jgi:catechol 2,3-dioxygenase-like lactoylglutathione lyase family enzyme
LTIVDAEINIDAHRYMGAPFMPRIQAALNVSNIDEAVEFYRRFFNAEPAKRRPGYANFAGADPPLKLVLIEGAGEPGSLNHIGIEIGPTGEVASEAARLNRQGFTIRHEDGVTCCGAKQDKVWVTGADHRVGSLYGARRCAAGRTQPCTTA